MRWRSSLAEAAALRTGDRIGGRYVVERSLGAGGGGDVFLCRDDVNRARVAVKLLQAHDRDPLGIERAGLLSVDHPRLVRMLHSGAHAGAGFVVSELVEGGSLADVAKPLEPQQLHELAAQMLDGLAFLHGLGILHGDVKTENIFVVSLDPPQFKLGDFGLASRLKDLTPGGFRGSLYFTAPEAIRGEPLDER